MGWGVHDYPTPPEQKQPICPVCGEECDTLYRGKSGEIFACDNCLEALDAWDYMEDE